MDSENIKAQVYSHENNPVPPKEHNTASFMKRGSVTSITMGDQTFEVLDKEFAASVQLKINELQTKNKELQNAIKMQNTKINELSANYSRLLTIVKNMGQDILKNNWK